MTNTITRHWGASVFSPFRLAALNRKLREHKLQLSAAHWLFLAQWDAPPEPAASERLVRLVDAAAHGADADIIITPRVGTLSPWSSKATDIAALCDFPGLRRLERARGLVLTGWGEASEEQRRAALALLHDPLTESVAVDMDDVDRCFETPAARPLVHIELGNDARAALARANGDLGLALSEVEIDYLAEHYQRMARNPTDAELMMFAQINSEHCRHKIFNARWTVDGAAFEHSLFDMIRMTYAASPDGILSAYSDNAAVLDAAPTTRFVPDADGRYRPLEEAAAIAIKVETHNHPTAIAPDPGAATGAGGEIRDEAATGRGGKPKAGLCGFSVGDLNIPGYHQPWERRDPVPARLATALDIMRDGPIGAARYNNEFGRPNLAGYFRTLDVIRHGRRWGYLKPIMIAGGIGNVRPEHALKNRVEAGAKIVILGGPGMLIGLGGGAASSVHAGASDEQLDFASVQRANPEMERRCQEVIDACWRLGEANPIQSIHDIGAGGLSNAVPEILNDNDLGGRIDLGALPSADPSLSPMELWCNESQERYVIALRPEHVPAFEALCRRERCPFAVIGEATAERKLLLSGAAGEVVALDMSMLLGKLPPMQREARHYLPKAKIDLPDGIDLGEALERVLRLPAVASKSFLITIGDRTVTGLVCRDQMVGPWQIPVADVAVTAAGYEGAAGEAFAMGERAPVAVHNAPASGRLAVGEAITNIAAAAIGKLADVRLSANWMAACNVPGEDDALLATVKAVGAELCPELKVAIPVGKDSLSMQTRWPHEGKNHSVTAPVSLVISAFAPVTDVARTLTPQLQFDVGATVLLNIDLGGERHRLGGSALSQVYGICGGETPNLDEPARLAAFFELIQALRGEDKLLAYHDHGDGGLIVTLLEMAFAGHCGLSIDVAARDDAIRHLFAEELGAVIQVRQDDVEAIMARAQAAGLGIEIVGAPSDDDVITIRHAHKPVLQRDRKQLQRAWAETSYRMQALRDDPDCAREEFDALLERDDPGLQFKPSFETPQPAAPAVHVNRPRVAILREQGVNGQVEMAWMFDRAGFEAVDVHMSDVLSGDRTLDEFRGVVACGGFSYGDVLGAGRGWARTILFNDRARDEFEGFLARTDRFALGVCNGCQMFAALRELVPGTEHWPLFERNRSEQFEARLAQVLIPENNSVFLSEMAGSLLPIAAAHGEGRAEFADTAALAALGAGGQIAMRFTDHHGVPAERYPLNPNGSPDGVTGVTNADGRVTIMMPHPERLTRAESFSWAPKHIGPESPWLQMFLNARRWLD